MYQLGELGQPWTDFTPSSPKYSDQKTFIFDFFLKFQRNFLGAIALSYPPRVRVRATAKLSAAFFHDESSITIGGGGGQKCNSATFCWSEDKLRVHLILGVEYSILPKP